MRGIRRQFDKFRTTEMVAHFSGTEVKSGYWQSSYMHVHTQIHFWDYNWASG